LTFGATAVAIVVSCTLARQARRARKNGGSMAINRWKVQEVGFGILLNLLPSKQTTIFPFSVFATHSKFQPISTSY
jgi:hypothetical protein